MARNSRDDERPGWRDADDDEPRDWEIEPEEEKEDHHGVLGGTAPLARVVFFAILLLVAVGGALVLIRALARYFGR